MLRYVEILKLNDEEAETLVGSAEPEKLRALGVPEVILTLGSQGAWVVTPGLVEHVPSVPVDGDVDPTGAGDTYSVTYLRAASGRRRARRGRARGRRDRLRVSGVALEAELAARDDDGATAAEHPVDRSAVSPSARAKSVDGRPISTPCEISIHSPHSTSPCRRDGRRSARLRTRSRHPLRAARTSGSSSGCRARRCSSRRSLRTARSPQDPA